MVITFFIDINFAAYLYTLTMDCRLADYFWRVIVKLITRKVQRGFREDRYPGNEQKKRGEAGWRR
jgi:hypothetical protein